MQVQGYIKHGAFVPFGEVVLPDNVEATLTIVIPHKSEDMDDFDYSQITRESFLGCMKGKMSTENADWFEPTEDFAEYM